MAGRPQKEVRRTTGVSRKKDCRAAGIRRKWDERKAFHIFAEVIAFIFSATILVFGGFQVSQLAMGQQTSSLGVAVGVFYWVMPICGVIILVYSVLNIIGIANGSICLDTPEDADFAKVEAEMAADADKENKED